MASPAPGSRSFPVIRLHGNTVSYAPDEVAVEAPLEIFLHYKRGSAAVSRSAGITFRTPGHDEDLVRGFLFNEGVFPSPQAAQKAEISLSSTSQGDIASVRLPRGTRPNIDVTRRATQRSSSCGACGKISLSSLSVQTGPEACAGNARISPDLIHRLPELLAKEQQTFHSTGGLHAAALVHLETGELFAREDIGRHNAVDKVLGHALRSGLLPADRHVLFVTSRAGYEIVQKALVAGIQIIATVGAPSTLALKLASDSGATLLGFVRNERCNVYSGFHRLKGSSDSLVRVAS